ncbi:MAG: hypothetical protein ACLP8S_28900 [Solirubrobacteraceae bacterium]|jgi:hypothetical protein
MAAVERGFEQVTHTFTKAAAEFDPASALPDTDVLDAIGNAYRALLESDRDSLMLQHQAYAACDDELIRNRVRACFARLVAHVQRLSGTEPERIDELFRDGMWLNVAAAMGAEDLSATGEWIRAKPQAS